MSVDQPSPTVASVGHSAAVEMLRRWEESGAIWRVASDTSAGLTIVLMRCDGGEEVDRLVSDDPGLVAFVADRSSNKD